ncbi:MAG: GAF domain-containing SpoIIE family protein phosphatase, partial [Bacteroidota bacterium]
MYQGTSLEQLSALDAISHLLTASNFNLDILLNEICQITAQTLRVKACAIRLLNKESGEMVLKAASGLSPQYLAKGPVIAAKSAFREVIESGEVTEIFDVSTDSRLQYSQAATAEGICSQLVVGLLRDSHAIGALSVFTVHPHHFTEEEIQIFQTIANQAAVAVHLAHLHQEQIEMKRIEQELAIAADIQTQMMPTQTPQVPGIDIAAWSQPCEEVGGDFYDFIELPNANVGIAVGDASGKGIPAALLIATVRTSLRVQAENIYAMREIIQRVNRALCHDTRPQQFATLFYGVLNSRERIFTYVNAGHNYPLLFRGDQIMSLKTGGPPVGFFSDATYQEEFVTLLPNDLIVIYTDGFTETLDSRGEIFGEDRFCQVIRQHRHLSPKEIIRELEDAVSRFECASGDYCDDRTLVVLRVRQ